MSAPGPARRVKRGATGAGGASPKMSAICLGDRIVSVGTVTVFGFDVVVGRFRRRRETSGDDRSGCGDSSSLKDTSGEGGGAVERRDE